MRIPHDCQFLLDTFQKKAVLLKQTLWGTTLSDHSLYGRDFPLDCFSWSCRPHKSVMYGMPRPYRRWSRQLHKVWQILVMMLIFALPFTKIYRFLKFEPRLSNGLQPVFEVSESWDFGEKNKPRVPHMTVCWIRSSYRRRTMMKNTSVQRSPLKT